MSRRLRSFPKVVSCKQVCQHKALPPLVRLWRLRWCKRLVSSACVVLDHFLSLSLSMWPRIYGIIVLKLERKKVHSGDWRPALDFELGFSGAGCLKQPHSHSRTCMPDLEVCRMEFLSPLSQLSLFTHEATCLLGTLPQWKEVPFHVPKRRRRLIKKEGILTFMKKKQIQIATDLEGSEWTECS